MKKVQDFKDEIIKRKQQGAAQHKAYIDIDVKELNRSVSGESGTLTTGCLAMYGCMLEGDAYLERPKGKTGYGSRLTIRYYLHDLEHRIPCNRKKRGRPAGESVKQRKLHEALTNWLLEQDMTYERTRTGYRGIHEGHAAVLVDIRNKTAEQALMVIAENCKQEIETLYVYSFDRKLVSRLARLPDPFRRKIALKLLWISDLYKVIEIRK